MQSMSATSIPRRLALPAALVIFAFACMALAACAGSSHGGRSRLRSAFKYAVLADL